MAAVQGISIVIPNYNGAGLLPVTLPTVFLATNSLKIPWEIIVVDDCSTDHSIEILKQQFPRVKLVVSEKNKGFSPTVNAGVFSAVHSHVLILNSDVKLTENYFANLLRYFQLDDTFGVVSKIIGWDNENIQDAGKYPSFHGLKIKTSGNYVPESEIPEQWLFSMYLSGANALVDREKFMLLGGFNELFAPFYIEDFELCIRAWRLGWKCYYDDQTICRHKESITIRTKERTNQIKKIYYRNKMYLHALHLPAILVPVWWLQLIVECLANLLVLRIYYIKSLVQYCGNMRAVLRKRKEFTVLGKSIGRIPLSLHQVSNLVLKNIKGRDIRQF